jgi:large subunit ribosomal protein L6
MEKKFKIPAGASVSVSGKEVTVKGPRGELKRRFDDPRFAHAIEFGVSGDEFYARTGSERRNAASMAGTIVGHVKNMAHGVTDGYKYTLKIVYTHFPVTVSVKGNEVEIKNFLGERGTRRARVIGDAKVTADKESVTVTGADIESVSQTAANIEQACRLTRRDRRIFIDGIYLSEKMSEAGKKI